MRKGGETCRYCGRLMNAPGRRGDVCGDQACKAARRREQQQKKLAKQAHLEADYQARCDQVRRECQPLQDYLADLGR